MIGTDGIGSSFVCCIINLGEVSGTRCPEVTVPHVDVAVFCSFSHTRLKNLGAVVIPCERIALNPCFSIIAKCPISSPSKVY